MVNQAFRLTSILLILLLLSDVLGLSLPAASGQSPSGSEQLLDPPDPGEPATKAYPKLDSALAHLVIDGKAKGTSHARALAEQMGIAIQEPDSVRVIIESDPAAVGETTAAAEALGAVVEATYQNMIQARVPLPAIEALAQTPGVKFVERPLSPVPDAVTSEGVNVIGANTWQAAGLRGAGVKVAIVDIGFQGYTSLLGTELPATVTTYWAPSTGGPGSSPHGTACAEIIYDIAPDATLYLVNVGTPPELGNAVDWLISQEVDIISHSVSWIYNGAGDGTGFVDSIVDNARGHGILWVNAAGNYAQEHWSGSWSDSDGDNWLNFSPTDVGNTFPAVAGDTIRTHLRWSDPWGASTSDYNLYLGRSSVPGWVASSTNVQTGSQDPFERIDYPVTVTGNYFVAIWRYGTNASTSVVFDLLVPKYALEYQVAAGSIANPADSPNALTVGAVAWGSPGTIEYYSSQGPTRDGRTKPDVVAPARVSTASYGAWNPVTNWAFAGTSAATPHVAGAAALVKQANPVYTPSQIKSFLEGRAVDLGAAGKDNVFGSGRVQLGSPPTLTITPNIGNVGALVTLSGAGMTAGELIPANSITFGGVAATHPAIVVAADGTWSAANVPVPSAVAVGSVPVVVWDSGFGGSISSTFTVSPRIITLVPVSGVAGSQVVITGSGFKRNGTVNIQQPAGITRATATADAAGSFQAMFTTSFLAAAGGNQTVVFTAVDSVAANVVATANFSIPGAAVTVSPASQHASGTVTVAGTGFAALTPLTSIFIGATNVTPAAGVVTDATGAFSATVVVPGTVAVGGTTVTVTQGAIVEIATFMVEEPAVSTIAGVIALQGRSSHLGIRVTAGAFETETVESGAFTFTDLPPGTYTVTASMPGYLPAQRTGVVVTAGQTIDLGTVTLLAGDLNGDGVINVLDLTMLGLNFGKTQSTW